MLILLDRCGGEVNVGWLLELLLGRWALLPGCRLLLLLLLRLWRAGLELLLILVILMLLATALVSAASAAVRRCASSLFCLRLA